MNVCIYASTISIYSPLCTRNRTNNWNSLLPQLKMNCLKMCNKIVSLFGFFLLCGDLSVCVNVLMNLTVTLNIHLKVFVYKTLEIQVFNSFINLNARLFFRFFLIFWVCFPKIFWHVEVDSLMLCVWIIQSILFFIIFGMLFND